MSEDVILVLDRLNFVRLFGGETRDRENKEEAGFQSEWVCPRPRCPIHAQAPAAQELSGIESLDSAIFETGMPVGRARTSCAMQSDVTLAGSCLELLYRDRLRQIARLVDIAST